MKLQINNGHIIDPANNIDKKGSIYIEKDKIVSVLKSPSGFTADKEIDAKGLWVIPGVIDLCARFREPGFEYKATITSESLAAAASGVTSVCCPPDTEPVIDTSAVVELIHQKSAKSGKTRIYPIAALTHELKGETLAEMMELKEAGCIGVSNAHAPIVSTEVWRRAMEYAATADMTVFIQPMDHFLRNNGVMHEGAISTRLGLPPIPETAETIAVGQALLLIEQTGARVHFGRLSSAKSIQMIAKAKKEGLPVTADVSICHLHLTEFDVDGYKTDCHLLPPLRQLSDKEALISALANGDIDAVCSDHQPHDDDAKAAPFSLTEPGASTIEVLLSLTLDLVHKKIITPMQAITCLTKNPANILGLNSGQLSKDSPADIVLIDPSENWTVEKNKLLSDGKNCPFRGWEMAGKVKRTLLNGKTVFKN